jgi:hypothetical protein
MEGQLMLFLPYINRIRVGSLKPQVFPGSQSFGYGSYSPVIQEYNTLVLEIWGAGGGGGRASYGPGSGATAGGTSYFAGPATIYAYGGQPGTDGVDDTTGGSPGAPGGASGGDVNTAGGGNPGGAGGHWNDYYNGGPGGYGGYVRKTWTWGQAGAPVVGASYGLVCQAGGAGGIYDVNGALNGYGGSNASARLTWS